MPVSPVMFTGDGSVRGWVLPEPLVPRSQAAFCMMVGRGWCLSGALIPYLRYGDKEITGY